MKFQLLLKIELVFVLLVMSLASVRLVAQGTLVFNGDFEAGLQGWSLVRGATIVGGGHPSLACILASTNASPGTEPTASQLVVNLTPGFTYLVSGDYKPEKDRGGAAPTNPSFGVAFDGVYWLEITSAPVGNWSSFSFYYTASSANALLSLTSQINGTGLEYTIDNIAMFRIPEPSSSALVGCGGLLLAVRFFRERQQARRR